MNERHEEILEALYKTGEVDEFTYRALEDKCTIAFGPADLLELEAAGLIVRSSERILFTAEGKAAAERIVRRHRLAESLLWSILKLKDQKMEEIACQVEHTLLPEVEEAICTLLGHPDVCPDGKAIPPGQCCRKQLRTVSNVVVALSELKPGESGKISYIRPSDHSQLHQLLSFGLHPGISVTVHRTTPALCVRFENTELALHREIAQNIFVLKCSS